MTRPLALALLIAVGAGVVPAGARGAGDDTPVRIVVTTDILGSIVRDLVGDEAEVRVLIEGGVDPHAWAPSARDTQAIFEAHLVVANGSGLEEGLDEILASASGEGVSVFEAAQHVSGHPAGEDRDAEHEGSGDAADEEQAHEGGDPHFWLDPLAVRDVVLALVPVLAERGVDVADRGTDLVGRLEALDAEVSETLAVIPPERRRIVTGHESMGSFAARYGFELIGAVVPGLSSQGEVSAGELADLAAALRASGVDVVLTEVGTPEAIAEAIAAETGARLVPVSLEQLPADASYATLIRDIAATLVGALGS